MSKPLVHLELHTGNLQGACDLYRDLCGWRPEGGDSYLSVDLGQCSGGMVECPTPRPLWLPYVEVTSIAEATKRARLLGASVLLDPREGPTGWRSVVTTPAGGELAFWQPKR
jgi:predicted enzyme related to lactoylglutathione lyase